MKNREFIPDRKVDEGDKIEGCKPEVGCKERILAEPDPTATPCGTGYPHTHSPDLHNAEKPEQGSS